MGCSFVTLLRRPPGWCLASLVFLPLLLPVAATAQDNSQTSTQTLKALSLEQLGNIEVTTLTKEPKLIWKTAAAVFVITQDDIQRSGVTSIPEALRLAPGVEVARISSNEWSIGIRGFGSRLSRSVLVLIDGRIVYSPLTAGVYWEVQDTMMEDIDRIEVIRGPGGTIWGPNAVNGVINIITKDSKDTQGGLVSAGGGNFEHGFGEARYGSGNGKDFTYRLYGKGFGRGPEFHPNGINYDDWRGRPGRLPHGLERAQARPRHPAGRHLRRASRPERRRLHLQPAGEFIANGEAHLSGGNILGRWRRTFGEGKDFQLNAYYDRTDRHELNFGDVRNTVDIDFLERLPAPRQEISWGLGLYASHGDELEVVSGLYFDPNQRTDQIYSAFLQDEIAVVPNKLSFVAGTKFLKTNYTSRLLEPSLRLLYTPTSTHTFWASVTQSVRTPADVERDLFLSSYIGTASDGLPFFARINANRNFKSERLTGYEAGYRRLVTTKLYLDLATFFNQYHDLLSEDLIGLPFVEDNPAPTHLLLPASFGNGLKAMSLHNLALLEVAERFEQTPGVAAHTMGGLRGAAVECDFHEASGLRTRVRSAHSSQRATGNVA